MLVQRVITDHELDSFVAKSPFVHYMKTSAWGRFKQQTEHLSYTCLGFFDANVICATAMVLKGSFLGHSYLYVPKGPCLDYGDASLREEVFTLLSVYAKEQNVQFLRVDPNVIRRSHTITGEVTDAINNEAVTEQLIHLGYRHRGYNYAYDGSWTNRYTLIIDIDRPLEEIRNGFSKPRKTSLNRHLVNGVETRLGNQSDIGSLMEFEQMLSEQDGFRPHTREFFEELLNCFGDHARLYVTEINLEQMITGTELELNSKKYRKDPEARQAKEKELVHARELYLKYGASLPIACGLFLYNGTMSWDLYTYNHKEFNFIKPVDNLHLFAIKDMKALGVKQYDMCGFSGVTTKDDPEYGLYAYKRSFGPEYIEQIGEFDYVLKEAAYKRFQKEKSLEVRARHKYWRIRYRKK